MEAGDVVMYGGERCVYCDAPIKHVPDGLGGFWEGDTRYTDRFACPARRGHIIHRHEPGARRGVPVSVYGTALPMGEAWAIVAIDLAGSYRAVSTATRSELATILRRIAIELEQVAR